MGLHELEAQGRLRVYSLFRTVEGQSWTVAELEGLGIQRQRLKQLRNQKRLLGIKLPSHRGFLYPHWQLTEAMRPREIVQELVEAGEDAGLDSLGLHLLLTNPRAGGGETPLEMIERGRSDLALNVIRTADEMGS